ncbi:hypothetical protein HKD28_01920 [Gluconobacter sp. LMG 1744]|uniref:hypothetical protein n=1 Tax=Gluconobacter cadivus TaxID=2728101 RepID=UPI001884F58E|nr:hypothetical protein [Gluconobacter cadivus]MBF0890186.1 hypothetical protein [Gluconobacter cadivus]
MKENDINDILKIIREISYRIKLKNIEVILFYLFEHILIISMILISIAYYFYVSKTNFILFCVVYPLSLISLMMIIYEIFWFINVQRKRIKNYIPNFCSDISVYGIEDVAYVNRLLRYDSDALRLALNVCNREMTFRQNTNNLFIGDSRKIGLLPISAAIIVGILILNNYPKYLIVILALFFVFRAIFSILDIFVFRREKGINRAIDLLNLAIEIKKNTISSVSS